MHVKFHRFSLSPSSLFFLIYYLLHHTQFPYAMASETNQTLLVVGNVPADDAKTASGAESDIAVASSSSNATIENMLKKDILVLTDY
jgi:hypothetical protein